MKNNKQVKMGNKPKAFGKGPKADGKKNNKNSAKPNKPAPAVAQKSMAIKKKNNKKPNLPSPKTKLQSQPQIKVVATKSSDESDLSDSELELDEMNVSQLTNESIGQDAADLLSSSGSEDDAADLSLSQSVADDLLSSDDEENIAMGDEDDEDLSSEPEEPVKNGKQSQAVKNGKKLVRTPEEQEGNSFKPPIVSFRTLTAFTSMFSSQKFRFGICWQFTDHHKTGENRKNVLYVWQNFVDTFAYELWQLCTAAVEDDQQLSYCFC